MRPRFGGHAADGRRRHLRHARFVACPRHRLASVGRRDSPEIVLRDIYTLVDIERHAVLDAMLREQAEPPMALVEGVVACVGGYDIDAILAAARRLR